MLEAVSSVNVADILPQGRLTTYLFISKVPSRDGNPNPKFSNPTKFPKYLDQESESAI